MIFLDSNIILRYLTAPQSDLMHRQQKKAEALILAAKRGEQIVTLSEIVLHECSFILASKHHYGLPITTIADYLTEMVNLAGMRLPRGEKSVYLRALDIYRLNPKLGYADSIIAARSERLGVPLATFDSSLSRLPFIEVWDIDG